MNNMEKARDSFESSFAEGTFYNRQTQDRDHLERILDALGPLAGKRVLDLGTGSGYLAFAIAGACGSAHVTGLDIVENTLRANAAKAESDGVGNIEFLSYDGKTMPFEDEAFDWVVTRYALHHFPDIGAAFREMERVLKPGGGLFVADPTPNETDTARFVDAYMRLKDDGHNRFYTQDEFTNCAGAAGLAPGRVFRTAIRFPRPVDERYHQLVAAAPESIKCAYEIEVRGGECFLTEEVLNMVFTKS